MRIKRNLLLLLLIATFLSGRFTMPAALSLEIEIRFMIIIMFFLVALTPTKLSEDKQLIKFNKGLFILIFMYFTYVFIASLSIYISDDPKIAVLKLKDLYFIGILIFMNIYALSKFSMKEYLQNVSMILIVIGFVYALPVFLSVLSGSLRGYISFSGPNVATRILFFATCASLYMYKIGGKNKIFYFLISILFILSIIFIGSRGGMVAAILSLGYWISVNKSYNPFSSFKLNFSKILIYITPVFVIILMFDYIERIFYRRFIRQTFTENGIYTSGRDNIYEETIKYIADSPIVGYGINGYSILTNDNYPHNLILEMMIDIGLFGLIFSIFFIILSLVILIRYSSTEFQIYSTLPFYMIVVNMFSGDMYDFRYFFIWAISIMYFASYTKQTSLEIRT